MKKTKEDNELKSAEVDIVTNFVKDDVESSSDADVGTDDNDDDDHEQGRGHWV